MKERNPISIKVEPELHQRLEEAAAATSIKKYSLIIMAMEALVEALEQNDWKLVVPVKFDVTHIPRPRAEGKTQEEQSLVEDSEKPPVNYQGVKTSKPGVMHEGPPRRHVKSLNPKRPRKN